MSLYPVFCITILLYRERIEIDFERTITPEEPNFINISSSTSILQVFNHSSTTAFESITLSSNNLPGKNSQAFYEISASIADAAKLVVDASPDDVQFTELTIEKKEDLSDPKQEWWKLVLIILAILILIGLVVGFVIMGRKRQHPSFPQGSDNMQQIYEEVELEDIGRLCRQSINSEFFKISNVSQAFRRSEEVQILPSQSKVLEIAISQGMLDSSNQQTDK